jgi:SAM-dependent methyltransferase
MKKFINDYRLRNLLKKKKKFNNLKENYNYLDNPKIEKIDKKLVDLGKFKNNGNFGSYYSLYKNINNKWVSSHAEVDKGNCNLIAKSLFKFLKIFKKELRIFKILDLACGPGHITKALKNIFLTAKIYGVDPSIYGIKYAKRKFPDIIFKVGYLENLNKLKIGRFDLIYSRECYPFTRTNNIRRISINLNFLIDNLSENGIIVLENYSLKGINLLYKELELLNCNNFILKKIIKFPNKLFFILYIINNKKLYLFTAAILKIIFFIIKKNPTYYIFIQKNKIKI